jgi:curved DNA-binding protein CbpA
MSHITVDFDSLKFNLYEVLGIDSTSSENKIKKAFRNLILHFHPDKNNDVEEEIYYHIITANQILTNKENRIKYDNYLNKNENDHTQLKNNYNKVTNNNISNIKKDDAIQQFKLKCYELDKKHLFDMNTLDTDKINTRYEKVIKSRANEINIPKEEHIKSNNDFNQIFNDKINSGKFDNQLIQIPENNKLATYNVNDNYTSLDIAFENLYIDGGGITTSKFSSLDSAFQLQPVVNNKHSKLIDIKQAMNEYKSSLSNVNYSKEKYEYW